MPAASHANSDTFYIGITMAGAISAGAYTAGVLDVLLEALDLHNARQAEGEAHSWSGEHKHHPRHKVVLRVISGTSAGGVSAGLAVAGLVDARRTGDSPDGLEIREKTPTTHTSHDDKAYTYSYSYTLKPLHDVWIEKLDLYRPAGDDGPERGFLTVGDLDEGHVVSALNTSHIDDAASAALKKISYKGGTYRFIASDLDLFLTTTNLQGVTYRVGFSDDGGDKNSHSMAQHSTVRHFRVRGLGTSDLPSPWLEAWQDCGVSLPLVKDREIPFDGPDPKWADVANADNWIRFKNAAVATGAFPVGLAPRVIRARAAAFGIANDAGCATGGAWPINQKPTPETCPKPVLNNPDDPAAEEVTSESAINYVAVDGGVANNEPFELARYTLRQAIADEDGVPIETHAGDKFLASNPRGPKQATCTVLMIDPFPEGPTFTPLSLEDAHALTAMVPAAAKLVPALINQARFKPGELIEATNRDVFSRYLLAPSRSGRPGDPDRKLGAQAIASGCFGGFGGFFDHAFRAHDYMLGQRNARSFLKRRLVLHKEHETYGPLFADAAEIDPDNRPGMIRVIDAGEAFFSREINPLPLPPWPRISQKRLDPILEKAETRVRDVGGALLRYATRSWFQRIILGAVWSGVPLLSGVEKGVSLALRRIVMSELIERDQHHDFRYYINDLPFEKWQRQILVKLAESGETPIRAAYPAGERPEEDAAPDLLSVLVNDQHMADTEEYKRDMLRRFLDQLEQDGRLWKAPWRPDEDARYTLSAMRPGSVRPRVSALRDRFSGWFG
jgi:hypothetical protein